MNTSKEFAEEKDPRRAALQTQINTIMEFLAQRVRALETENQATDLQGFNVDRLCGIAKRVNALAEATTKSRVTTEPPANLAQLKRTLRLLLDSVGDLEAQRFEPAPLPEEVTEFRTGALGEKLHGEISYVTGCGQSDTELRMTATPVSGATTTNRKHNGVAGKSERQTDTSRNSNAEMIDDPDG
jgi:hypothetical protein